MLLESLESRHMLAVDSPWHNASHPADVNGSGYADTLDLALLVNELRQGKGGQLSVPSPLMSQQEGEGSAPSLPNYFVDVTGDNVFDTLDLAHLISQLQEGEANARVVFTYKATATNDPNASAVINFDVGSTIFLHAFVEDRRDELGESIATNQLGVFAAALDLHYTTNVSPIVIDVGPPGYDPGDLVLVGSSFDDTFNTELGAPGVIENIDPTETGGFVSSQGLPQHAFTIRFQADATGSVTFAGERAVSMGEGGSYPVVLQNPSPPFVIDPDEVDYGTLTIEIMGAGNPPVANDDPAVGILTTNDNTALTSIDVLSNDTDDNPGSLVVSVSGTSTLGASVTVNLDRTITYNPNASAILNALDDGDAPVQDTFTYTLTNSENRTDTATVTITVTGINDVPIAVADEYNVIEGFQLTQDAALGVLNNDIDPDDPLVATLVNTTTDGTLVFNIDGSFTYTPDAGFTGTDQFTYFVNDGTVNSNTVTVTLNVRPIGSEALVRFYFEITTLDGTPVSLLSVDQDFLLRVSVEDRRDSVDPSFNPALLGVASPVLDIFYNALATADPGSVSFNPVYSAVTEGDFSGAGVIDDVFGATSDVEGNQLGGDPIFFFSLQFTATAPGILTFTGQDDNNPVLPLVFQVPPSSPDSSDVDFGFVQVEIVDADPPIANDDTATTTEDSAINIDVTSNDDDGSGGDDVTIVLFTGTTALGATITLNLDGTLRYDPTTSAQFNQLSTGDSLVDSFSYTIENSSGLSDIASVQVTVNGVNDLPIAVNDSAATDEETPILIDVLANDSDPDGNPALLTVSNFSAVSVNGAAISLVGGQLRYDPTASATLRALQDGESIIDTFTYVVRDEDGGTSTATVFVTVSGISDSGVVSGRVFFDMNSNGNFDAFSDKPIGGVQIVLTSTLPGFVPLTTVTRGDGTYSFGQLSPGEYTVREVHPEHVLDGIDKPGLFAVIPPAPINDLHTINLPLNGVASGYNFAERGLTSDFIANGSVLNSTTAPGIVFAFNEAGGIEWFSFMPGWNGFVWAELDIASNLSTVTLTVYDAAGNAQRSTFAAIRPKFRFLGTNSEGYVVHVSGKVSDFNFTPVSSPATIPGSSGAVPLDPSAVDALFADLD